MVLEWAVNYIILTIWPEVSCAGKITCTNNFQQNVSFHLLAFVSIIS